MAGKKINSRWSRTYTRYSPNTDMEDARYVRKRGIWRLIEDTVTELDWIFRRRERAGFHRGARVSRRAA